MRYAARTERERETGHGNGGDRRATAPSEVLLALQRGAGNRAVAALLQRKLVVSAIDWDPDAKKPIKSELSIHPMLEALRQAGFKGDSKHKHQALIDAGIPAKEAMFDKNEAQRFGQLHSKD